MQAHICKLDSICISIIREKSIGKQLQKCVQWSLEVLVQAINSLSSLLVIPHL